ncbi:hypothetical protein M409DRAFT_64211 [Zasmidium cellare ATCC 36951]|uniref:FAD/NAD(P)-binding domain-containing protein n=1 Tax=Zasmidium cellare ATCC 36951 TaxID=1080233 RepID=A0A6A6CXB3_ZASCE|nr:uncharacterized protein M409DRAFT_64211 [Zasmidium cellare ATCC 36951]KAF2170492.1 hypothetical protein M409DRAFT_64211 [Zasmidium cellare ATCC 36951]
MVKRVAVIGAGASGAAAAAALQAEDYFDIVKVFERRDTAGGVWNFDPDPGHIPLKPGALPPTVDPAVSVPSKLPCTTPPLSQNRFDKTPVYDGLLTNVPDVAMCFTDFPFPYGPFVGSHVPKQYIQSYFSLHQTDSLVSYNTTVEDLSRLPGHRWKLALRKHDAARNVDEWWEEEFDAVILANGHYGVPYIPQVTGLEAFISKYPKRVEHSKAWRTTKAYRDERVLIIGNSASGYDITQHLLKSPDTVKPIYLSRRSKRGWDDGDPPDGLVYKPVIKEYKKDGTILFEDGSSLKHIDKVIYCTGYKASFPFWNSEANGGHLFDYKANRLINSYQHVFFQDYPTLATIGFPVALTFRSFEYQAVAIARLWAGRNALAMPSIPEQKAWEHHRAEVTRRTGQRFHQVMWDSGECTEWLRWFYELAGLPTLEGHGRSPPVLDAKTRWAIDHVRRYPGPRSVEGNSGGKREDALWFL